MINLKKKTPLMNLKEIYEFKYFLLQLIYRNFSLIYKQTVFGPFWQILNPLIQSGIFSLIFGKFANIPTAGIPPFLFYSSAMLAWVFFESTLLKTANSLINSGYILRFAYFPKIIIPISILVEGIIFLIINLLIFLIILSFYFYNGLISNLNWGAILFLPLVALFIALLATFIGMIISCWGARYRDLMQIGVYGVRLLFYASPIIYSLGSVPSKLQYLFYFNPITYFLEYFRMAFFNIDGPDISFLISAIIFLLFIGIFALKIFNKFTKNIIDYV